MNAGTIIAIVIAIATAIIIGAYVAQKNNKPKDKE